MRVIQGSYDGAGLRIGVVVGRSNELLTKQLLVGALDGLRRHGVDKDAITVVYVPGIGDLALTCRRLAEHGSYDALIALGVDIGGGNDVSATAAMGITTASLEAGVPISFGVVACDTYDAALERAGGQGGNRGFETALSAIEMARVLQQIGQ